MNEEFKTKYSKFTCTNYNKESIKGQIGIRRAIYDIIMKGDINDDILFISKFNINIETGNSINNCVKYSIKSFLKSHKNDLIMTTCHDILCFITSDNKTEKIKVSDFETVENYKKALESLGFSQILFSSLVDGYAIPYMIYVNDKSKEIINVLKDKGMISKSLINN